MITVAAPALGELEQVLGSGCIAMDRVRVVYDWLPGRSICAATIANGLLWLVVDLDKPSAHRHALAMVRETMATCETFAEVAEAITRRAPLTLVS